jgi:hypothetical protein
MFWRNNEGFLPCPHLMARFPPMRVPLKHASASFFVVKLESQGRRRTCAEGRRFR